jgi:exosome complex RNA-binding protein Rrp42 (RNase PH superfamily)
MGTSMDEQSMDEQLVVVKIESDKKIAKIQKGHKNLEKDDDKLVEEAFGKIRKILFSIIFQVDQKLRFKNGFQQETGAN